MGQRKRIGRLLSTILTSRVVINERKATIRIGYINDHTVWKQYRVTGTKRLVFLLHCNVPTPSKKSVDSRLMETTDRIRPPIEISIFHFAWTRSKIFQSRTSNSFPFRSCLRSGGKEARDLSSANYTVGRSATKCKLFIAFVNVVRRIRAVFALSRARTPSSTLPRSRQIHLFARL